MRVHSASMEPSCRSRLDSRIELIRTEHTLTSQPRRPPDTPTCSRLALHKYSTSRSTTAAMAAVASRAAAVVARRVTCVPTIRRSASLVAARGQLLSSSVTKSGVRAQQTRGTGLAAKVKKAIHEARADGSDPHLGHGRHQRCKRQLRGRANNKVDILGLPSAGHINGYQARGKGLDGLHHVRGNNRLAGPGRQRSEARGERVKGGEGGDQGEWR